jgi:small conductance mechanosensitive channel
VIYYLLYVVVIIAALSQLGISTTSFLAILGTMGLAIGLAFKDSLGNLASGIMIIFFKPIEIGNFVTVAGESGTVFEVGIFNTTIMTADDTKIIVPNSAITSGNIKNFTATPNRRVEIKIKISYSDDIKTARAVISSLFDTDSRVLKTPEPAVVVSDLSENGVEISTRMWCVNADFWAVYFDMNEKIKEALQKAELTIHIPAVMKMINN